MFIDITTKMISIVCPVLKRKEIDEDGWRNATEELIKAEENTKDLNIPAENLFNIATRVLKDMSMYMRDFLIFTGNTKTNYIVCETLML